MSAQSCVSSAAFFRRQVIALLQDWRGKAVLLFVLAALNAGCASVPPRPLIGADPADSAARVPAVRYRSTIGPYTSQRPVDPTPWGEHNERVAPAPRQ
jgi:hypothetical protein